MALRVATVMVKVAYESDSTSSPKVMEEVVRRIGPEIVRSYKLVNDQLESDVAKQEAQAAKELKLRKQMMLGGLVSVPVPYIHSHVYSRRRVAARS